MIRCINLLDTFKYIVRKLYNKYTHKSLVKYMVAKKGQPSHSTYVKLSPRGMTPS